jgi:hypothetical protein
MTPATRAWTTDDANAARRRHDARNARVARRERVAARQGACDSARAQRQAVIAAALARARARRAPS